MRRSCTGDGYVTRGTSVAPRPIRANSKRRRHAARQRRRSLHPGRRQGAALRALSAARPSSFRIRRFGPPTTDCKSLRRKCATLSSTPRRNRPAAAFWAASARCLAADSLRRNLRPAGISSPTRPRPAGASNRRSKTMASSPAPGARRKAADLADPRAARWAAVRAAAS